MADDAAQWIEDYVHARYIDYRDVSGRPLGEVSSRHYVAAGVDERTCTYPDRRAEHNAPMNMAAFRQVIGRWDAVRNRLDGVRRSVRPRGDVRLVDAWKISAVAKWHAASGNARSGIEVDQAAVYKTCLGYSRIFLVMVLLEPGQAQTPVRSLFDAEGYFDFLDRGDWLVGARQVCAGTQRMIEDLYEVIVGIKRTSSPVRFDGDAFAEAAATLDLALIAATCAAREKLHRGEIDEVPGYGRRPDERREDLWPRCVRMMQRPQHPIVQLVLGLPEVKTTDVLRVWRSADLPLIEPPLEHPSFEQIDRWFESVCLDAVGRISATSSSRSPVRPSHP